MPGVPAPLVFLFDRYPSSAHDLAASDAAFLRSRDVLVETASLQQPAVAALSENTGEATLAVRDAGQGFGRAASLLASSPGVAVRGLRSLRRSRGQARLGLSDLKDALTLGQWMRSHGVAQVYATLGERAAELALMTAQAWGVPFSLSTRGSDAWLRVPAARLEALVRGAAVVICDSHFCRSQLMLKLPAAVWDKLRVVQPGVSPAALTPALPAALAALAEARPVDIVCVAPLIASKGHRVLIDALALLRERGAAFSVTFVGDGPERQALWSMAEARGMADRLVLYPVRSHEAAIARVREADLFVLPSLADTLPMALIEAMALGLACVSTTVAAIPELIQTGRDGVLVAPSDVEALADAVGMLANDGTLRQFLGRSARRRVVRDYNLPLNQEQLLQHLLPVA